jgi:hypothetical protein
MNKTQLSQLFKVRAIPTLVLLDLTRQKLVSMDGCQAIASDPQGKAFPWTPKAVAEYQAAQGPQPLSKTEARLLRLASESLALSAMKTSEAGHMTPEYLIQTHELLQAVQSQVHEFPGGRQLFEGEPDALGCLPSALRPELTAPFQPMVDWDLAAMRDAWTQYAGGTHDPPPTTPPDLLAIPESATTLPAALQALTLSEQICNALLDRARDEGTSSRLVILHEIIQLIGNLFTRTLPLPAGRNDDMYSSSSSTSTLLHFHQKKGKKKERKKKEKRKKKIHQFKTLTKDEMGENEGEGAKSKDGK